MLSADTDFGKVAVLMGGSSSERDISLQSGQAVLDALRGRAIDADIVDPQDDLLRQLETGCFDRAFIALHGRGGEDGLIQGTLETLQIPYTGSGVLACSLSMDKCQSKRLWESHQLPTPEFKELDEHTDWEGVVEALGLPLAVKPVREGSSYGISKVHILSEMEDAWHNAYQYDQKVMAESWLSGQEYTVSILDNEVLPIIRLETPREFYDYQAKYTSDTTEYHCPSGLQADVEQDFIELALDAFKALNASGWGRVDLLTDADGRPSLIELNTVPGLTTHSLVPMSAKKRDIDFSDLILKILATSFCGRR